MHVLVIPRGRYVSYDDFAANATDAEIVDFNRLVARVCQAEGLTLAAGGKGFRAITNAGEHGVQEVPHFHLHLLGGQQGAAGDQGPMHGGYDTLAPP